MTSLLLLAALVGGDITPARMEGDRLRPGSVCYTMTADGKAMGTTAQTIAATRIGGRPVWDIVIHQKVANGVFDMRDHFVVDRRTLLPLHMDSQRGSVRTDRGWHRITIDYAKGRITGTRETATATTPIDVAADHPVWDGNLWGVTFAALPLRQGGRYTLPFWQYDKGFGQFTLQVVGRETVTTPSGRVAAWIVEAGDDPTHPMRYRIAHRPRQELGYVVGSHGQQLGGTCF
jgi:hypothetical protein